MTLEITDELQLEATRALIRAYGANIAAVDMHSATLIVLTAALPIIEKAVREQCAAEIDTFAEVFRVDAKEHFGRIGASSETYLNALIDAARIVREGRPQ